MRPEDLLRQDAGLKAAYEHFTHEGTPVLKRAAVLYADLLGTSQMAQSAEAAEHLVRQREAVRRAAAAAHTNDGRFLQAAAWFTDNFVLAAPVAYWQDEDSAVGACVVTAAEFCVVALGHGALVRGAIALGDHYMDEQFVFGPALVAAVKREEEGGPARITLLPEAFEAERASIAATCLDEEVFAEQTRRLWLADDGLVFVSPFDVVLDGRSLEAAELLISPALEHVRAKAGQPEDAPGAAKWRWMAALWNATAVERWPDEPARLIEPATEVELRRLWADGRYTPPQARA